MQAATRCAETRLLGRQARQEKATWHKTGRRLTNKTNASKQKADPFRDLPFLSILNGAKGELGLPIEFKRPALLIPLALVTDGYMLFGVSLEAGAENVGICVVYFFRG